MKGIGVVPKTKLIQVMPWGTNGLLALDSAGGLWASEGKIWIDNPNCQNHVTWARVNTPEGCA